LQEGWQELQRLPHVPAPAAHSPIPIFAQLQEVARLRGGCGNDRIFAVRLRLARVSRLIYSMMMS
jgi:hypothetical protein